MISEFKCAVRSTLASRRTIEIVACLLAFTLANQGQSARPDFTGLWRSVRSTLGPAGNSMMEIKQSESTLSLRPVLPNQSSMDWSTYSTDGRVITTKTGRHLIERTGHWDGNELVLLETGPSDTPWRRSTEQRTLSLSGDGSRMTTKIHHVGDKKGIHDFAMESERVKH